MGAVPCTGPDCSLCKMFGMEGPSRRQMWWTKWSYRVKRLFRRG